MAMNIEKERLFAGLTPMYVELNIAGSSDYVECVGCVG